MRRILCQIVNRGAFLKSEMVLPYANYIMLLLTGCLLEFARILWWRFDEISWMKKMVPCCCTGSRSCTIDVFGFLDTVGLDLRQNCSNTDMQSFEVQRLFYSLVARS